MNFPCHTESSQHEKMNKGTGVIDMARTKRIEKYACKAEDFVKLADVPNPFESGETVKTKVGIFLDTLYKSQTKKIMLKA